MPVYLKNGTYIDWQTFAFRECDIQVGEGIDGKIELFPPNSPIPRDTEIIDCSGKYITKSFANGHHHVYSALARGMPAPANTPVNFKEILEFIWWNLDKNIDPEMIRLSALVTAIECARNGVTFVIDHHSSPAAIAGSLDIIAKAFEIAGISHLLCYETSDRDGPFCSSHGLEETGNYLQNHQGLVGLHAAFTISNETLIKAVNLCEKYQSGIHIHVAEDHHDQLHSMENFNQRVVERLKGNGALNFSKTILGHCLYLSGSERTLLKTSPSWIVQNIESNLKNKVGFFNSAGLGENIMLGTDGLHSDMIRSAKTVFFVGQNFDKMSLEIAYSRLRNVHRYLAVNGFAGDGENNLVVFDYKHPTEFNQGNFLGHFFYGLESKHICHVIANGKPVLKNRQITFADEGIILKESVKMSAKLWQKMKQLKG